MSWNNVLPFWVLMVECEEHEARTLGAFQSEVDAGFLRSVPQHVAEMLQSRQEELYFKEL